MHKVSPDFNYDESGELHGVSRLLFALSSFSPLFSLAHPRAPPQPNLQRELVDMQTDPSVSSSPVPPHDRSFISVRREEEVEVEEVERTNNEDEEEGIEDIAKTFTAFILLCTSTRRGEVFQQCCSAMLKQPSVSYVVVILGLKNRPKMPGVSYVITNLRKTCQNSRVYLM